MTSYSGAPYQAVASVVYTPPGPGYQQIVANISANMMNQTVDVGDLLAFSGMDVAKEMSTDGTTDFKCNNIISVGISFNCAVDSVSSNGTAIRHLAQLTVVQPVQLGPMMAFPILTYRQRP
jgi:hypothetical protein